MSGSCEAELPGHEDVCANSTMQSVRRRRLLYQPCCLAFLLFVSFWNAGVWWSFESAESALFPPLNTPAPLRRPLLSAGYQRIGSLSVPQKKPYNVLARTTGSNHDQPHLVCTKKKHSKRGNRLEVQVWLGESVDLTRGLYVVLLNRYRMRALLRAIAILNVSMFIIINTRLALFVNKSTAF